MAELIDFKVTDTPRLYAVGMNISVDNTGDNPLPAEWGKAFESGLFAQLEALPDAYCPDYVGLMHSWPGDMSSFEYLIGMLFTALPEELPEGLAVVELDEGRVLCGYVRGPEAEAIAEAHDLTMERVAKSGYEFDMERLFLMEGYNCPRYTQPDEQGRVIFDYYIPVRRKGKK